MASSVSIVALISAILSIFAIAMSFLILRKVYQEEYKKPWLYIGISAVFVSFSQILSFLNGFFDIIIYSQIVTLVLIYFLDFVAIVFLAYGLLLEYFILEFYKGKFIKLKFIPVQEGTLGGEIDINVSKGNSYLAHKKDRNFLLGQFSEATRKGFEGFLLIETNPKEIREKYKLERTPIAWISQIESGLDSDYVKSSLDSNSDMVDPIELNNIISYIDNFLEQSENPFIFFELDMILRVNNFSIVFEFLKYVDAKIKRFNGIMVVWINNDSLGRENLDELKGMFNELE